MNYGEAVAEVMQIIPLPHKEPLVRSKINQIIRFLAGTGDYWRALEETTITAVDGVDPAIYVQEIPVPSNFRALLYVQYPSSVSTAEIKVHSIKDLLHLQKCQKSDNTAYVSGSHIRIKHSTLTDEFNIGYYVYPENFATDGSQDSETNWILTAVPGLVIDLTTAYILNLNGDNEDSNRITSFAQMMQLPYLQSQINGAILT